MADIFNEVDEELRRQRLKDFWNRFQVPIIAVALAVVLGVGGWRGYEWWQLKKASESGAQFESAVTLVSEGKFEEAEAAFAKIGDQDTAYRVLARLRQAGEMARRDRDGALKIYDALATDGRIGTVFQDLARVRGGQLVLDTAPFDDMTKRMSSATDSGRVFRHSARELMAFSAWRAGNAAETKKWVEAIMADTDTPPGIRTRTEMLLALSAPDARS